VIINDSPVVPAHTPVLLIYKRTGDTFTKLDNPDDLPGSTLCCAFSTDSNYLAVGADDIGGEPIFVYKRSGDVFTKLSGAFDVSADQFVFGVKFSPDGTHFAAASNGGNYLYIYTQSGDTFTKVTDPADMPLAACRALDYSSSGTYLAVAAQNDAIGVVGKNVWIYKNVAGTFTKVADPDHLLSAVDQAKSVAFSPDDSHLAYGIYGSPYTIVYKRSGDVFSLITGALHASSPVYGMSYAASSNYLALAEYLATSVSIYQISGDTYTKYSAPDTGSENIFNCAFSPNDDYLAVVGTPADPTTSLPLVIYKHGVYDTSSNILLSADTEGLSKTATANFTVSAGINYLDYRMPLNMNGKRIDYGYSASSDNAALSLISTKLEYLPLKQDR
jgi:WD40 repeat protein